MAKIGFISLGCAKNQVDCERMMYRVQEAGHEVTMDLINCDVVVINTCGFIDSAKAEAIEHILQTAQLKAEGVVGKILVTGCLSQRYQSQILEQMPEVDGVLGTGSYHRIVPVIEALLTDDVVVELFDSIDEPEQETGRVMTTPEYFAYIKIAEGCDNRCSYCIIPYLRGKYRSRTMDDVLYEARLLAASGVKELIVVAQDTCRYGTDFPEHKRLLPELLRQLCQIDGIHWVRVHYLYPDEIDDELIDVIAQEEKIVKYLDIPIQHCNDHILKLMNRRGGTAFLRELFAKLRQRIPGLVLRTSVITGLPGEGEAEFAELCEFLKELPPLVVKNLTPPAQNQFGFSQGGSYTVRSGPSPVRSGFKTPAQQPAIRRPAATPAVAPFAFEVGDRVFHKAFGNGTLLSKMPMGNDLLLEVKFDKVGSKKIMANYAKLTKAEE